MATTTVGEIIYDARYNLAQLRKDAKEAEKIVNDSYKKMSKGQKSVGGASGAKSQAEAITKTTQAQVEATKQAAQESFNSISKYSPQIQRQFLAVERANNQVYNASTRSAQAIQKYGADSVQATRATNSLNVAVQNQALAQNRLDTSLKGTDKSLNSSKAGMIAFGAAVTAVAVAIGTNLGGAISRSDTLANFPNVMSNLKIGTDESRESIELLASQLKGLPTSLDAGASAVQRLTAVNKDVKASTALFLGFNNAVLAGGQSTQIQATALEQMSQAYAKGKPDMMEWRALISAMPAQLDQVAQAMGKASADELGESLREGKTSMDDFLLTISQLNTQGANGYLSFTEQARNATGGLQTTIDTTNSAIQRSINSLIDGFGRDNIVNGINMVGGAFETTGRAIGFMISVLQPISPIIGAVTAGLIAMAAAQGGVTAATILGTKAMAAFRTMLNFVSAHPVIGTLTLLAGVITGVATAVGLMNSETDKTTANAEELENALQGYEPPIRGATDATEEFGKQMAKIDEQIKKANEDYRYRLAELVADKNKNIANLTETLRNEEKAYNNAYAERLASFNKAQDKEELSHKEKTRALQNQIDFLTKYNTAANAQRRSELQFELARENAEYQKSTQLRQDEFAAQTKSAREEYEKRRNENQKKLNEELALLEKHRLEVLSVRGVMLRDEIESLKRSRDEQLKSLQQQTANLRSEYAKQTAIINEHNKNNNKDAKKIGEEAGKAQAEGFRDGYAPVFKAIADANKEMVEANKRNDYNASQKAYQKFLTAPLNIPGRVTGGGVKANQPYWVGENPDGSLNRTSELFVPNQSGTIISAKNMRNIMNEVSGSEKSRGGDTIVNVSLNMSGIMASGKADMRKIATDMAKLINEAVSAKTGKVAIQGV